MSEIDKTTNESEINDEELTAKKSLKRKKQIKIFSVVGILLIAILMIPVSERVSYQVQEKYDVPYTVKEAYTVEVSYVDRVAYEIPVYKTVEHEDPIYETLYTYQLIDSGVDTRVTTIENVYDAERLYTGTDVWGNDEYKVTMYNYEGLSKFTIPYYEINAIKRIDSYQKIVGYNQWSEKVIDKYETKYKSETKYRTETEYRDVQMIRQEERSVTKHRTVNPMLFEAIFFPGQFA